MKGTCKQTRFSQLFTFVNKACKLDKQLFYSYGLTSSVAYIIPSMDSLLDVFNPPYAGMTTRTLPQLILFVAVFSPWRPGFAPSSVCMVFLRCTFMVIFYHCTRFIRVVCGGWQIGPLFAQFQRDIDSPHRNNNRDVTTQYFADNPMFQTSRSTSYHYFAHIQKV